LHRDNYKTLEANGFKNAETKRKIKNETAYRRLGGRC